MGKGKHIVVSPELYNKLRSLAHYGQTLNGVIKEMLDVYESNHINDVNKLLSAGSLKKCNKHGTLYLGFEECEICRKENI